MPVSYTHLDVYKRQTYNNLNVNHFKFNFLGSHNLLKNPHSYQLWIYISQKKEKLPYPRCGFGAYLRCG